MAKRFHALNTIHTSSNSSLLAQVTSSENSSGAACEASVINLANPGLQSNDYKSDERRGIYLPASAYLV